MLCEEKHCVRRKRTWRRGRLIKHLDSKQTQLIRSIEGPWVSLRQTFETHESHSRRDHYINLFFNKNELISRMLYSSHSQPLSLRKFLSSSRRVSITPWDGILTTSKFACVLTFGDFPREILIDYRGIRVRANRLLRLQSVLSLPCVADEKCRQCAWGAGDMLDDWLNVSSIIIHFSAHEPQTLFHHAPSSRYA